MPVTETVLAPAMAPVTERLREMETVRRPHKPGCNKSRQLLSQHSTAARWSHIRLTRRSWVDFLHTGKPKPVSSPKCTCCNQSWWCFSKSRLCNAPLHWSRRCNDCPREWSLGCIQDHQLPSLSHCTRPRLRSLANFDPSPSFHQLVGSCCTSPNDLMSHYYKS